MQPLLKNLPLGLLLIASLLTACNKAPQKTSNDSCLNKHRLAWDYSQKQGPLTWGEEFEQCTGSHQSPIDINTEKQSKTKDFSINYQASKINLIDNEHTIEIDYDEGSTITAFNDNYSLKQFHFHSPSEHRINGARYDLEIHLVHKDAEGQLLVLGIFAKEGKENHLIHRLWHHLPKEKGKHHIYPKEKINISDLLPKNQEAYYYEGSLTTPPCSERVKWIILKEVIEVSREQLDIFHNYYNWNVRSTQG